jgi:glucuronokinase
MNENFDTRLRIYGEPTLGSKNLAMVSIARRHHAAAKFPGSGGAVLVAPTPGQTNLEALRCDLERCGFVLVELLPCAPSAHAVHSIL